MTQTPHITKRLLLSTTMPLLPFSSALSPLGAAIPLKPYRVEIAREGTVVVKLRASVTGSQALFFTAPSDFFTITVKSLTATDSRGGTPLIYFPSPHLENGTGPKDTQLAWLSNRVGEQIELHHRQNSVRSAGRLLAVHVPKKEEDNCTPSFTVFLERNGRVFMHHAEDVEMITMDGDAIPAPFELPGSTGISSNLGIPVVVIANGEGVGEINIVYETSSCQSPPFDFRYKIRIIDAVLDGTLDPSAVVKCSAVVSNPLHFDLEDVELCLTTNDNYRFKETSGLKYDVEKVADVQKINDESDEESTTLHSGTDSDEEYDDMVSPHIRRSLSVMDLSTPELVVINNTPRFIEEIEKISLERGGSALIELDGFKVSAKLVYMMQIEEDGYVGSHIEIKNLSDKTMQAGHLECNLGTSETTCKKRISVIQKGMRELLDVDFPAISVDETSFVREGKEIVHDVLGQQLVTRLEWTCTTRLEFLNMCSSRRSMIVVALSESIKDGCVVDGMLFKDVGSENLSDGLKIKPEIEREQFSRFDFDIEANGLVILVVRKLLHKVQHFDMMRDCSEGLLASLEKGGTDDVVMTKLRAMIEKKQEMQKLNRKMRYLEMCIESTRKDLINISKKNFDMGTDVDEDDVQSRTVVQEFEKYMAGIESGNEEVARMQNIMEQAQTGVDRLMDVLRCLRDEVTEIVTKGESTGIGRIQNLPNGTAQNLAASA